MPKWQILLVCFGSYWLLTMFFYQPSIGGGFVDDFLSGIMQFDAEGWAGFKDSYDFSSLYYGHNLVFYGYYHLFGASALAWFLLFTGLHSLNATLAFGFLLRVFTHNHFKAPFTIAVFSSLIFLVSPYQTENVIWGATLHYAVSMLCLWGMMYLYASYLVVSSGWKLLLCYGIFVFSLVTLEISVIYPGIMMLVFGLLWQPSTGLGNMFRHFKTIALPMSVILAGYFMATFFLRGHVIGHYGEAHLKFAVGQIMGTFWQYCAKLLGFVHFLSGRATVYETLQQPWLAFGLLVFVIAIWLLLKRYRPQRAWFLLGWLALVFITLLPVLNMQFIYLHNGENARLSYFASLFIYALPILLLSWYAARLAWVYALGMLLACMVLLPPQVSKWHHASKVQAKALNSPAFYGSGKVYLLNFPCYFDGVYIFRNIHRLYVARGFHQLPDTKAELVIVMSANMRYPNDSVTVKKLDGPNTYKVDFSSWGNWFWYNGVGALNRNEDGIKVTLDDWGLGYTLEIQDLKPEDRLLYLTPSGWREVKRD